MRLGIGGKRHIALEINECAVCPGILHWKLKMRQFGLRTLLAGTLACGAMMWMNLTPAQLCPYSISNTGTELVYSYGFPLPVRIWEHYGWHPMPTGTWARPPAKILRDGSLRVETDTKAVVLAPLESPLDDAYYPGQGEYSNTSCERALTVAICFDTAFAMLCVMVTMLAVEWHFRHARACARLQWRYWILALLILQSAMFGSWIGIIDMPYEYVIALGRIGIRFIQYGLEISLIATMVACIGSWLIWVNQRDTRPFRRIFFVLNNRKLGDRF